MKINVEAMIKVPKVPNFFIMDNGEKIPISAVKEEYLREIGESWTEDLIRRAKEQLERGQR